MFVRGGVIPIFERVTFIECIYILSSISIAVLEVVETSHPMGDFLAVELLTVDFAFAPGVERCVIAVAHVLRPAKFGVGRVLTLPDVVELIHRWLKHQGVDESSDVETYCKSAESVEG